MRNKLLIIAGIILGAISVVLVLYAPTLMFPPPTPTPTPTPPAQPFYEQVTFQLSTDTTPGNTDEYDSHSFNIYLKREQELYLSFHAEGAAVLVSVTTPYDEKLGYNPGTVPADDVENKELGYLLKGKTVAMEEGSFRFNAPESGSHVITVKSATPKGDIDVRVEYWILEYRIQ